METKEKNVGKKLHGLRVKIFIIRSFSQKKITRTEKNKFLYKNLLPNNQQFRINIWNRLKLMEKNRAKKIRFQIADFFFQNWFEILITGLLSCLLAALLYPGLLDTKKETQKINNYSRIMKCQSQLYL